MSRQRIWTNSSGSMGWRRAGSTVTTTCTSARMFSFRNCCHLERSCGETSRSIPEKRAGRTISIGASWTGVSPADTWSRTISSPSIRSSRQAGCGGSSRWLVGLLWKWRRIQQMQTSIAICRAARFFASSRRLVWRGPPCCGRVDVLHTARARRRASRANRRPSITTSAEAMMSAPAI